MENPQYNTYYYSIQYEDPENVEEHTEAQNTSFIIHPMINSETEIVAEPSVPSDAKKEAAFTAKLEPLIDSFFTENNVQVDDEIKTTTTTTSTKKIRSSVKGNTSVSLDGGRPKKGRKQKIPGQSREERKQKANTNKAYINAKGKEVKPKEFDETFNCNCPKKCCEKLSVKVRRGIFKMFWNMGTYEGRCCFINGNVNELPKKRTYVKKESRRKHSRKYYLKGQEVCKITFCKTLMISSSRIDISLSKLETDSIDDRRGRGRKVNALSEDRLEEVLNHISSFPTSDGKHLSSELTLRKMYQLYRDESDNPVSESSYKKQFYQNFNLKFKKSKKESSIVKIEKVDLPAVQFE